MTDIIDGFTSDEEQAQIAAYRKERERQVREILNRGNKSMKAHLIDPVAQTVTEIDTPADYYAVRELLGVEIASAVYPRKELPRLIMWLDDLGLMHDEVGPLWEMNGVGNVLAGRGLLLGLDDGEGDHVDCPHSREEVEANITWRPDLVFKGLVTTQDEIEHPVMGKTQHIKTEAIFEKKGPSDGE